MEYYNLLAVSFKGVGELYRSHLENRSKLCYARGMDAAYKLQRELGMAKTTKTKTRNNAARSTTGRTATAKAKTTPKKAVAPTKKIGLGAKKSAPRGKKSASQIRPGTLSVAGEGHDAGTMQPHVLVFLPGFMGSKLKDPQGNVVWLDVHSVPAPRPLDLGGWVNDLRQWLDDLFAKMRYPHPVDDPDFVLEPAGVIDSLFRVLPFEEHYKRIKETLKKFGYVIDPDGTATDEFICYTFGYDWRQDNRKSAEKLKQRVDELQTMYPDRQIWLMGHSNGGIVARWYLEKLGGKDVVKRLFLLASPWDGSPKAVNFLKYGLNKFLDLPIPDQLDIPRRTRETLRSFPAIYQLVPSKRKFLFEKKGNTEANVDPFKGTDWLDGDEPTLLEDGRAFNRELGNSLSDSYETLAFVGYNYPTTLRGTVRSRQGTRWGEVDWDSDKLVGDGTVPLYSAEFNDARDIVPVIAEHSHIYVHEEVKKRLWLELVGIYQGLKLGTLSSGGRDTDATIALERDVAHPGNPVNVTVTLTSITDSKPIQDAEVRGKLLWLQELPGSPLVEEPKDSATFPISADGQAPGRYHGAFPAPAQEGYYELEASILPPGEAEIKLQKVFVSQISPQ